MRSKRSKKFTKLVNSISNGLLLLFFGRKTVPFSEMSIEILDEHLRVTDEDIAGLASPEVVRETTDCGQVLWLNSSPKPTSAWELQSQED